MPIEVHGPNGEVATFPDGTPQETVLNAMRQAFGRPKPEEPKADVSLLESGLRGASQGITFGFGDEIAGVGTGIVDAVSGGSFSEGFNRGTDENRAANEAAREANPGTFLAGEIGSSVLIPGAAAKLGLRGATAVAKSGLGARSLAAAKEGAVYGGLFGAGHAEGGVPDRLIGAAKGATAGAVVGGVLPGAVDVASGAVRAVANPLISIGNPERIARLKLGEALARDLSGADDAIGPVTAIERAADKLQFQRARWNPAGNFVGETRAAGDPLVRLADVGGEATRDLLRVAANQSSKGSSFLRNELNKRQHYQFKRLSDDLSLALGNGRQALGKLDELEALAVEQSKPLFDAAFAKNPPVTKMLVEVLNRPAMLRIKELAVESAQNAGSKVEEAPVKLLHRMKMEIDRQIGQAKRGVQDSKANWDVRTLVKLKSDLKKAIRVPEYHAALKAYSGPHALRNAIEDGADDAFRISTHEMQKKLSRLGRDEANAYRIGVSMRITDKMHSKQFSHNKATLFDTPDMQERLRVLIPSTKARRRFQRAHQLEKRFHLTRSAVQGGSTTAKQLTQGQEAGQPVQGALAAGQVALGKIAPVVNWLSRAAARAGGLSPEVADRVIRNAMDKSGRVQIQEWRKMLARAEREPQFKAELVQRMIAIGSSQASQ